MITIFKWVKSISLRKRLMIAIAICILLPWIMTYIVSNYLTKDVLENRAVNQSEQSLQIIEISLKKSLDDIMYLSNFIQFDTDINMILNSYNQIDQHSPNARQQIALHHIEISKYLKSITDLLGPLYITILFDDGLYYMNYSIYDHNPLDFYRQPWFDNLKYLKFYETYWLGAHRNYIQTDIDRNPYLFSIARVIGLNRQSRANVIISFRESEIGEIFRKFASETNQRFYLTDRNGVVLSSVNPKEIGEVFPYDLNEVSYYQVVENNGVEHLLVTYPVSYNDWRLVSLVPYKETIGNINAIAKTTILVQGAFLILFFIVLILLVSESTKPFIRFNEVTKEVEQGNLQVRTNLTGDNDVAKLGKSFDHMLDTIEEMIEQIKLKEEAKRSAELEMLQAQINPHFLFNTLNAIRLNILMKGDQDSAKLIQSLSSLLRMTINRNNEFIQLQEEINVIQHYVKLMNFRYNQEVLLELDINPEAEKEEVPRFILQPIIENAITHGCDYGKGKISISANLEKENFLLIKITDNGRGIEQETFKKIKTEIFEPEIIRNNITTHSLNGIGVKNVYQRMSIIYGEEFRMELFSELGKGTSFIFHIPRKEK